MKVQIRDKEAMDSLTVSSLRAYLEAQGWGNDRPWGTWATILSKEGGGKMWEVSVPNEAGGLLYAESVAEIIATLAEAEERSQLDVFYDLADGIKDAEAQANHKGIDSMTTHSLGRLQRVELRQVWQNEAQDFTPWLALPENLIVLSETLGMQLETAGQEEYVGQFRADILCRDTLDESWVLIENQLDRTDHRHLGQLLTYAAGLQTVTIIWIAASFTDEHRAAMDWLNEITNEQFRFFGLEVELWRIGDSDSAPKFNIVAKPNEWTRSLGESTRRPPRGDGEPSGLNLIYRDYWAKLRAHMADTGKSINLPEPNPPGRSRAFLSMGTTGFRLDAVLNSQSNRIGVEFNIRPQNPLEFFQMLKDQQEDIEAEIGEPLEWNDAPGQIAKKVSLYNNQTDPTYEEDWPNQFEWLGSTLVKFEQTFRQRIR